VTKEYIVQRTCTEVYEVTADSAEQAEEFIANNPSNFSMIDGETIDIEVELVDNIRKQVSIVDGKVEVIEISEEE